MTKAAAVGIECVLFYINPEFWVLLRGRRRQGGKPIYPSNKVNVCRN
jgi:hypothetical protein